VLSCYVLKICRITLLSNKILSIRTQFLVLEICRIILLSNHIA